MAALDSLLNIKPDVELYESDVKPVITTRTNRKAADKLVDLLVDLGPLDTLAFYRRMPKIVLANSFNNLHQDKEAYTNSFARN